MFIKLSDLNERITSFLAGHASEPNLSDPSVRSDFFDLIKFLLDTEKIYQEPHSDLIFLVHLTKVKLYFGVDSVEYSGVAPTLDRDRLSGKLKDGTVLYSLIKWNASAFLLGLVLFLLNRYFSNYYKHTNDEKIKLLKVFLGELRIAINAFRIANVLEQTKYDEIEKTANALSTEVIKEMRDTISNSSVSKSYYNILCLPVGFFEHAVYCNIFLFKNAFYLRIDNLSKLSKEDHGVSSDSSTIPGLTITTIPVKNWERYESTVLKYIKDLFLVKISKEASDKVEAGQRYALVYNKEFGGKKPLPFPIARRINWTPQPQQQKADCVVVNYLQGMSYRLERLKYKDQELMVWLYQKLIKAVATGKTVAEEDDDGIALTEEFFRTKNEEIEESAQEKKMTVDSSGYEETSVYWNIPLASPYFAQRTRKKDGKNYFDLMLSFLEKDLGANTPHGLVICGMPGCGKTELAFRFVGKYRKNFKSRVFCINATNQEMIIESFRDFLQIIPENDCVGGKDVALTKDVKKTITDWGENIIKKELRTQLPYLQKIIFIFDGLRMTEDLTPWLSIIGNRHRIIVTSVDTSCEMFGENKIELGTYSRPEQNSTINDYILPFMKNLYRRLIVTEVEAKQLGDELGWLPLAIFQAIHGAGRGIKNYLERFRNSEKKCQELLAAGDLSKNTRTIFSAWDATMSILKEKNVDHAEVIVSMCSFLAHDNIPYLIFEQNGQEYDFSRAIDALVRFSLLTYATQIEFGDSIKIHKIFGSAVREKNIRENQYEYFERTIKNVVALFPWSRKTDSDYRLVRVLGLHFLVLKDSVLFNRSELSEEQKIFRAKMYSCLSDVYGVNYDFKEKANILKKGLDFLAKMDSDDVQKTRAEILSNLGIAYFGLCQYEDQKETCVESLTIKAKLEFSARSITLTQLNLARAYIGLRQPELALNYLRPAEIFLQKNKESTLYIAILLEICRANLLLEEPKDPIKTFISAILNFFVDEKNQLTPFHAMCLRHVAEVYVEIPDKLEEAFRYLDIALRVQERSGSGQALSIALTKTVLAKAYLKKDQFDLALSSANEAQKIMALNNIATDNLDFKEVTFLINQTENHLSKMEGEKVCRM